MFTSRWAAVVATAALVAGCSGDGAGGAGVADAAAVPPGDAGPPAGDARPDRDAERPNPDADGARPEPDARRPESDAEADAATPPDPDDGVPPPPSDAGPPSDATAPRPDARLPDAAPPPAPPLITEFLARNADVIEDEDGEHSDYIELYNPSAEPRALLGWHLTDDPEDPIKWAFPDITLGAHRYLLVFASNKDRRDPAAELHTNFKLDGDGEYLALTDPAGAVVQAFDAVPAQRTDVSWGLPATAEITPLVAGATPARALFLAAGEAAPGGFV
jgi:hypothetical protein